MTESKPQMLDLQEANLMMVGRSVQETLCTGHHVECFPSLLSNPTDTHVRFRLLLSPFSRHGHWGLERSGTLPKLTHPAVWCRLVLLEPGHLTMVPSSPLSWRGSRVHHSIPDGGSIRRELSASPLGSLGWAPVVGVQCPKGWPSLSLSYSQPTDWALLGPSLRTGAAVLQFRQLSAQEPFSWAQQTSAVPLGLVTWVCHSPALWPALPSCSGRKRHCPS